MDKANECCRVEGTEDDVVICGAASIHGKRTEQQDRFTIKNRPKESQTTTSVTTKRNLFQPQNHIGCRTHVIGVFDGHLSSNVAHHLQTAFTEAFVSTASPFDHLNMLAMKESVERICLHLDHEIVWPKKDQKEVFLKGGSTANFCLVHPNPADDRIILGNIGDSRSLVITGPNTIAEWSWRQPLLDHTPKDELERLRIIAAGVEVEDGHIDGTLSTSRSFGDKGFKRYNIWRKPQGTSLAGEADPAPHFLLNPIQQPVIALPDVVLERWSEDNLLLMVTDGITCVLSNEQITQFLKQQQQTKELSLLLSSRRLAELARLLCLFAIESGSKDNCTAVLIRRRPLKEAMNQKKEEYWSDYIPGPYYEHMPSFHDAFMTTARLYLGKDETTLNQLVKDGKLLALKRVSSSSSLPPSKRPLDDDTIEQKSFKKICHPSS